MLNANTVSTHRTLTVVLSLLLAGATTLAFEAWQPKSLVPAPLFTAVFLSWTIWWFYYLALYLGMGAGAPPTAEARMKKAVGSALVAAGAAVLVWVASNVAPADTNLAVFPLHAAFVVLLLGANLDVV